MKVLLTGGSGFIGKNLLENISSKFSLTAPSHSELDLLQGERVKNFLQNNYFDVVVHTAGFGGNRIQQNFAGVFEKNRRIFLNLAENQNLFGRMIFLGSGAEYGKQFPIVKVKESDFGKTKPEDQYGKAKYFASEYISQHENIVNLRCFGVFGKYEDYTTRFISNSICRALFGMPIVIRQNVVFDYLYIKDLAKIIEHFLEHKPKEKFYNCARGEGVELLDLAKMVSKQIGSVPIEVKNLGLGKEYTANASLLKNELGNFDFTSYEFAISEMLEYYKNNLDKIDKTKLNFDA
jgi:GDP-L-fucose synthase